MRGETEQAVTACSCQQIAVLRIKSFVIADDIRCFVDGRLRDVFPLIVNPESLIFCLDEQTVAFIRQYTADRALERGGGGRQLGKVVLLQQIKFVLNHRVDLVIDFIKALHHVFHRIESNLLRLGIEREITGKRLEVNQVFVLFDTPYILVLQFLVLEQAGDGSVD